MKLCDKLIPFVIYRDRKQTALLRSNPKKLILKRRKEYVTFIKGGCLAGLFIFLASFVQQYGIAYTTVAKAGFLTALYVVFVWLDSSWAEIIFS